MFKQMCQTDQWPLYTDSYSYTAILRSLPPVLGSVGLETAPADSQVSDSCGASFANHLQCLFTASHARLAQQSSEFGVELTI